MNRWSKPVLKGKIFASNRLLFGIKTGHFAGSFRCVKIQVFPVCTDEYNCIYRQKEYCFLCINNLSCQKDKNIQEDLLLLNFFYCGAELNVHGTPWTFLHRFSILVIWNSLARGKIAFQFFKFLVPLFRSRRMF